MARGRGREVSNNATYNKLCYLMNLKMNTYQYAWTTHRKVMISNTFRPMG